MGNKAQFHRGYLSALEEQQALLHKHTCAPWDSASHCCHSDWHPIWIHSGHQHLVPVGLTRPPPGHWVSNWYYPRCSASFKGKLALTQKAVLNCRFNQVRRQKKAHGNMSVEKPIESTKSIILKEAWRERLNWWQNRECVSRIKTMKGDSWVYSCLNYKIKMIKLPWGILCLGVGAKRWGIELTPAGSII